MDDKKNKGKVINLRNSKDEEVSDYYVNTVTMTFSIYDVIFAFGKKTDPKVEPKPQVNVRMSPQHAKVFSLLLEKHIKKYEKDIGEIKLLPKLLEELGLDKEV